MSHAILYGEGFKQRSQPRRHRDERREDARLQAAPKVISIKLTDVEAHGAALVQLASAIRDGVKFTIRAGSATVFVDDLQQVSSISKLKSLEAELRCDMLATFCEGLLKREGVDCDNLVFVVQRALPPLFEERGSPTRAAAASASSGEVSDYHHRILYLKDLGPQSPGAAPGFAAMMARGIRNMFGTNFLLRFVSRSHPINLTKLDPRGPYPGQCRHILEENAGTFRAIAEDVFVTAQPAFCLFSESADLLRDACELVRRSWMTTPPAIPRATSSDESFVACDRMPEEWKGDVDELQQHLGRMDVNTRARIRVLCASRLNRVRKSDADQLLTLLPKLEAVELKFCGDLSFESLEVFLACERVCMVSVGGTHKLDELVRRVAASELALLFLQKAVWLSGNALEKREWEGLFEELSRELRVLCDRNHRQARLFFAYANFHVSGYSQEANV